MSEYRGGEPIEILLIEDNPGDVRLTEMAFEDGKINNNLHVARDGEEALDVLLRRDDHADAPRPDIVLLDLNLPKIDGHEVLKRIRADDELRMLPVVVLTSSESDDDVRKSYEHMSNAYVTKPIQAGDFLEVIDKIEEFWFTIVRFPPRPE